MMDYEIFKAVVEEVFKDYLPEEYKDVKVDVHPVKKVNCTMDGIDFKFGDDKRNISPTIYINDMYKEYKICEDLKTVLKSAVARMEQFMKEHPKAPKIDFEGARDNIVFQLINTEQNREALKDMPHREFQDLSVVYRWIVGMDERGSQSAKIDNRLSERLGFSEEQLYALAMENTKRIFPPYVISLNEITRNIFIKSGMPEEIADSMTQETSPDREMYVMSNEKNINGASILLYEDELYKMSERLGTNLFIMPSSIHEVIAAPADEVNPDELAECVAEINMKEVDLQERLSNQVYFYDKELRELTLATNTPNKRLDGITEKPLEAYEMKQAR